MKGIILTGATGMLGTAVINECIKNNVRVAAVVRPGSARINGIPHDKHVNVIACGLDSIGELPGLLEDKYDAFFHFGWADTDKNGRNDKVRQERNIEYTLKAAQAAAKSGCSVFLGAGSQAEYGWYKEPIEETFETRPETAYGEAKLQACKSSAQLCTKLGIKQVWARIFSVYGPGDSLSTMIMYCIDRLLKKERVSLTACTQTWDYLYCVDAAKALMLAAQSGAGGVYNVGSGTGQPLKEYVKIIADLAGVAPDLGFGDIKTPERGLQDLIADISKLKAVSGFSPSFSFEQGIEETIKWFREHRK